MNIKIGKRFFCLIVITLLSAPAAQSEVIKSIDCHVDNYDGQLFKDLYATTKKTAQTFCKELIRSRIDRNTVDEKYIGSILSDFAQESKMALDRYNLFESANYGASFERLKLDLTDFDLDNIEMPEFVVRPSMTEDKDEIFFQPPGTVRLGIKETAHCATLSPGLTCKDAFKDFATAFNPYRSAYDNIHSIENIKLLNRMGERWDDFLEVSKSQTFLEVYLTTWVHRKHFQKDHLVGPPKYQVIALHPHLIYDIADSAPEGSAQEMGLAVEWLGVNFWDLKVPFGVSLTSAYVDRPEVADVGHGLMFHINNLYSLGWSRHDDVDSFFVTLDLLKMFEDKKKQYDKYMGYFD